MTIYDELKDLKGEAFQNRKAEIIHTHLYAMCLDETGNLDRGKLDRLYFRQQAIERQMTKNPLVNARRLIDQAITEMCKLNQPVPDKAEVAGFEYRRD